MVCDEPYMVDSRARAGGEIDESPVPVPDVPKVMEAAPLPAEELPDSLSRCAASVLASFMPKHRTAHDAARKVLCITSIPNRNDRVRAFDTPSGTQELPLRHSLY